ncbi:hypothetical protein SCANM63S_06625 [Streptomyces canarius]
MRPGEQAPGERQPGGSSVRIGVLAPLTRPGRAEAGRPLLAGLELAVRDVNDAGGIVGRPLELVVRDTEADPRGAAAAVDELAGLGVAVVAGEYHGVVARAAAARADALGVSCSSAVLDALTEQPTPWVARLAPPQSRGWRPRTSSSARGTAASPCQPSRCVLRIRGARAAGPPRSVRRHRHRTRHARAGRQPRDSPAPPGRPPGADGADRRVRPPRPAPRRDDDRRSGRGAGVRRMGDVAGATTRSSSSPKYCALPAHPDRFRVLRTG